MRNLLDMMSANKGTPMRHPAYFVTYPNGRAFAMQLAEGRCLMLFDSKEAARTWIDALLPEPYRSQVGIRNWTTLEQVERWMEREGKDFDVVSPNPAPNPNATPMYEPIGMVLEVARKEAGMA